MLTKFVKVVLAATAVKALCPFAGSTDVTPGQDVRLTTRVAPEGYYEAFDKINFHAVKDDLKKLFKNSQSWWPADYGNYAPFFVRLAWHNSGSYRSSDGRGGPDGGRQRFDPERSWDDNTNLDKARKLLEPIKQKYGLGLSWGDLIILAGDTAIESMNGPTLGFCGGRIDDADGFWSDRLGPTDDQEVNSPCPVPGACAHGKTPFGTNVVGLIYVNPEGFHGNPDPVQSAPQIRATFGRMSMDDEETVALIGGGHAFGKVHGACPTGPGKYPYQDPLHPWAGTCGEQGNNFGKGVNAFTSGFEGPWTATPTYWNNEYFTNLVSYKWEKHIGPGGHWQWRVPGADSPWTTFANNSGHQDIMMLTTDVSLTYDEKYMKYVRRFAEDEQYLGEVFSKAWYKLTTRDMGPISRCLGDLTPEVQPFQNPLPAAPAKLADFDAVRAKIYKALTTEQSTILPMTYGSYGPDFVRLAWRCAATFRVSDYQGGCNGARIRQSPQKDWPINAGLDKVLHLLDPIKAEFGEGLSWADLIVLAGTVALEDAGQMQQEMKESFCGGRVDADITVADPVSDKLEYMNAEYVVSGHMNATVDDLEQYTLLLGLNTVEFTALMGARALGSNQVSGHRLMHPTKLTNRYYTDLLNNQFGWMVDGNAMGYTASGLQHVTMLKDDILLISAPEYKAVVQQFAADDDSWKKALAAAWTKLMNADRFDGPTHNVCDKPAAPKTSTNAMSMMSEPQNNDEHSVLVIESVTKYLITVIVALSFTLILAFGLISALLCCPRKDNQQWANDFRSPLAKHSTSNRV